MSISVRFHVSSWATMSTLMTSTTICIALTQHICISNPSLLGLWRVFPKPYRVLPSGCPINTASIWIWVKAAVRQWENLSAHPWNEKAGVCPHITGNTGSEIKEWGAFQRTYRSAQERTSQASVCLPWPEESNGRVRSRRDLPHFLGPAYSVYSKAAGAAWWGADVLERREAWQNSLPHCRLRSYSKKELQEEIYPNE